MKRISNSCDNSILTRVVTCQGGGHHYEIIMPSKKYNASSMSMDERKANSVSEKELAVMPRLEAKAVHHLLSGRRVSAVAGDRPAFILIEILLFWPTVITVLLGEMPQASSSNLCHPSMDRSPREAKVEDHDAGLPSPSVPTVHTALVTWCRSAETL